MRNIRTMIICAVLALSMVLAPASAVRADTPDPDLLNAKLAAQAAARESAAKIAKLPKPVSEEAVPVVGKAVYMLSKESYSIYNNINEEWFFTHSSEYKYDKKGRTTYSKDTWRQNIEWDEEKNEYVYEGVYIAEGKTVYDKKGNVIKYTSLEDGKETYRYEIKYNSKNQMTEEKDYQAGKLFGRYVYTYNKKGMLYQIIAYNGNNKKESVSTYTYDKYKNLKKVVMKDTKGKVIKTITVKNTYSGKRLVKKVEKGPNYTYTVTYYGNGNVKKSVYESADYIYTVTYYKNGIIKTRKTIDDEFYDFASYDKNGVLLKTVYRMEEYSDEVDYEKGLPVKETERWGEEEEARTYTFRNTLSHGRLVRTVRMDGKEKTNKTEYKYVKIG